MLKIFHNPRCSKSRQTLKLIEDSGVTPEIILYLENALTESEISILIKKLGFSTARDLMRKGEAEYKELGLKAEQDETVLIQSMSHNPRLIERPIVVKGQRAILGRPPENVLKLLDL